MKLRIFRITVIAHPFRRDSSCPEHRFVQVIPRRGAAKIVIRPCSLSNPKQSPSLGAFARIDCVEGYARLESKQPDDPPQEDGIHLSEVGFLVREFVPAFYC